ncbi:MAG: ATP synthase F0 subunit B [Desulfatibacillaceae bacterium]|nr:ATP synthase F0 subunit B [Desulfatibacillaceae bacterium]
MNVFPDSTVFIQIVNFLVLIFLMNIVVYKPIRSILARRREKIGGLSGDIGTARKTALEKEQELERALAAARSEGQKKKEALTEAAMAQEQKVIADINEKAATQLEQMRTKIAKDVAQAEKALEEQISAFAEAIAEKIMGRALQ